MLFLQEMLVAVLLCLLASLTQAVMEIPKFSQLRLLYPGYYLHGGRFQDRDIYDTIGTTRAAIHSHNTATLRISIALNKYGGRHAIGTEPIFLSKRGRDSVTGPLGQEYIFRNTAFGPFFAEKYGNPLVAKPNKYDHTKTMEPFIGKQGVVRLVSYNRKHPSGHVGLWDCDHFHQSRDWTTESHIISVEFWETPDSACPPPTAHPPPPPHLQAVDMTGMDIIERHNAGSPYYHEDGRAPKARHHRHGRGEGNEGTIWVQRHS